jgi:hypothetical protein
VTDLLFLDLRPRSSKSDDALAQGSSVREEDRVLLCGSVAYNRSTLVVLCSETRRGLEECEGERKVQGESLAWRSLVSPLRRAHEASGYQGIRACGNKAKEISAVARTGAVLYHERNNNSN